MEERPQLGAMDTIEQGEPGRARQMRPRLGPIAVVVAASLLTGLALAAVVVITSVIPTRTTSLTGAILMAFGLGWVLLAVLSIRFTDQPQQGPRHLDDGRPHPVPLRG